VKGTVVQHMQDNNNSTSTVYTGVELVCINILSATATDELASNFTKTPSTEVA